MTKKTSFLVEFIALTLGAFIAVALPTPGFSIALLLFPLSRFVTHTDDLTGHQATRLTAWSAVALLLLAADLPHELLVGQVTRTRTIDSYSQTYSGPWISPHVWTGIVLVAWFFLIRRITARYVLPPTIEDAKQ